MIVENPPGGTKESLATDLSYMKLNSIVVTKSFQFLPILNLFQ